MSPGAAAAAGVGGDADIGEETAVERHDERRAAGVVLEAADQPRMPPLDDANDRSLRATRPAIAFQARDHPVAVKGWMDAARRDVELPLESVHRMVGPDETEAAGVHLQPPGHELHPFGRGVAVPARADERTAIDECGQAAAHEGPLLAGQAQVSHQVADGHRTIDAGADAREKVFGGQHAFTR